MPFYPNDDRFYDQLNKSGDQYRQDRGRVAEEQAAHAREMGQIYGQAMPDTINAGLKGADWAQNRGLQNQKFQGEEAAQQRAEENQGFERQRQGRLGEEWGLRKPILQNDATQSNLSTQKMQQESDFNNQPADSEESASLGYHGGAPLTRAQAHRLRGDKVEQLGLDTAKQNLANSKTSAASMAQQMAQNAQRFQNDQYTFGAQKALTEYQNIQGIQDPRTQTAAAEEWRKRYSGSLMSPELLSNMEEGENTRRRAAMTAAETERAASTKLIYGPALAKAQELTDKLEATQQLSQHAKTYDNSAIGGGAYENANAKDARQKSADILDSLRNHQAAEKVRNGFFAKAGGIGAIANPFASGESTLTEQARQQASQTLAEFHAWYDRQDNKVQQLPEVARAYQQAQALESQAQISAGNSTDLRKIPSLIGPAAQGANTQANASFMGGQNAPQGYGQALQPTQAGFALGNIQLPGRPQPQQAPMGPGQVQQPGQAPGQDPYGLQKSSQPRAIPAGVNGQGGYYGSR